MTITKGEGGVPNCTDSPSQGSCRRSPEPLSREDARPIDRHFAPGMIDGVSEVSLHDVDARSATLGIFPSFFA